MYTRATLDGDKILLTPDPELEATFVRCIAPFRALLGAPFRVTYNEPSGKAAWSIGERAWLHCSVSKAEIKIRLSVSGLNGAFEDTLETRATPAMYEPMLEQLRLLKGAA